MNGIKNPLSWAAIIIALSVGYYFVIYLPQAQSAEALSKSQLNCSEMQDKVVSTYKQNQGSGIKNDYVTAQNHYNVQLKKCIVEVSDLGASSGTATNGVQYSYTSSGTTLIDAVENAYVGSCLTDTDKNGKQTTVYCSDVTGNTVTPDQFDALDKEMMRQ